MADEFDIFDIDPGRPIVRVIDGRTYFFRILSAAELEELEKKPEPPTGSERLAYTVSQTLCDARGNLILTEPPAVIAKRMSGRRLMALYKVAMNLNAITPEAVSDEKKDSPATQP
jgi:hypothetical protein